MTNEIQMKQNAENSMEDVDIEKQKKIKEKLKDMGVMPSKESQAGNDVPGMTEDDMSEPELKEPETVRSRRFSPVLVVVLLAFSTAGVLAYAFMSDEVIQFLSLNEASDSSYSKNELNNSQVNSINAADNDAQEKLFRKPDMASQNSDYRASLDQYRDQSQRNHNEWLARQRAEFEKRRAEFLQQNSAYQYNQPGFGKPVINQPAFNQPSINQQETNNQQAYIQPKWSTTTQSEPPQWVKDRQAEAEKQRAQYMQEIKQQQDNRYNNSYNQNYAKNMRPEYFNHPRMNTNRSQQDRPVQTNQPQQPEMTYQQNQRQQYRPFNNGSQPVYNYAPSYRYNPYNSPYGWHGRGYR